MSARLAPILRGLDTTAGGIISADGLGCDTGACNMYGLLIGVWREFTEADPASRPTLNVGAARTGAGPAPARKGGEIA